LEFEMLKIKKLFMGGDNKWRRGQNF
jgi:hypothetical protein